LQLPGEDVLREVVDQCRTIRNGTSQRAIQTFLEGHKSIKEAIERAAEIGKALTETHVIDLGRAKNALRDAWPFLAKEPDLEDRVRAAAASLADRLQRETFFRELAEIDQEAKTLENAFEARLTAALEARQEAYQAALDRLGKTTGWDDLSEAQQDDVAAPLRSCASPERRDESIPLLRSQTESCSGRLNQAITKMMEILEGNSFEKLAVADFFAGTIENVDQLKAALDALRERCEQLLARNKKILLQ
jgi:flagellar motility protein MotE (MotC chaperone)